MSQSQRCSSLPRVRQSKFASLSSIDRNNTAILPWILCTGLLLAGAPVQAGGALPTGGQYVAGQGSIAGSTNGLTINQASNHGIINWQGFSIGSGNSVLFNNGSGSTLNRVIGADISKIDGQLSATGSVYLINPQGIVIGPGGKVVTSGSFVASTRDISNNAFMSGGAMTASGTSNGSVVNAGAITSANGDAILVGRSVSNSGTISAPNGTAALAAGNQILLQPVGSDPRIAVSGGTGDATNSGTIAAAQAQLSSAGGNVYAIAGNNGGLVSATGTQTINGHVWLTAGGTTNVSGTVSATNANGSGGTVTARGTDINVSGQVNASATKPGQAGGTVSVIATDTTTLAGTIKAQGGQGGAGGYVETSGEHLHVANSATVSTTAEGGSTGTWLIDPQDFTIAASGGDITGATLSSELATTDVTILSSNGATAGNGDIFVDDAVSWGSGYALTLSAYRNIDINANIVVSGGGSLSLVTGTGTTGDYNIASGSSVSFTGGSAAGAHLSINGTAYSLLYSLSDVQAINATNSALGGSYALAQSLDATSTTGWVPIGTDGAGNIGNSGNGFAGTFAGLGNTISNLTINLPSAHNVGLFGYSSGTIRDVGTIGGSFSGYDYVGGLVGYNSGTVSNSHATVAVSSNTSACHCNGGDGFAGGLVGYNSGTVSDSYATGAVNGWDSFIGGLVGRNQGGTISDSHATGAVSAGYAYAGGLVGTMYSGGTISNSYATGTVTSIADVGGLVGGNFYGAISKSYATGPVSGSTDAGGLVGFNKGGTIAQTYATGAVNGSTNVGGLVGENSIYQGAGGTITQSYWDTQNSNQSNGVGIGDGSGVTGLTTTLLSNGSLPDGFDPAVWVAHTRYYPCLFSTAGCSPAIIPITYSIANSSTTYGTLGTLGTVTLSGVLASDAANVTSTETLSDSSSNIVTLSSALNAGTYIEKVTGLTGLSAGFYKIAATGNTNGTLTVNPATLEVTANALSKIYGTTDPTLSYGTSGLTNGDTTSVFSGSLVRASGETVAGGPYAIGQGTLSAGGNYTIAFTGANFTINPATLTASLTGTVEKTYDGTTTATLAATNYVLSGVFGSDSVSLNDPSFGNYDTANVGTGKTVSVSGASLTGADVGNYVLASSSLSAAIGLIDRATLTASLTGTVEKTYDGLTTATLTVSNYGLSGVIGSDSVSLNDPTTGTYDTKNIGTGKTVSVTGLAISGVNAGNYVLASNSAFGSVGVIDPAILTASLTGMVAKTYNGNTAATLTAANYSLAGVVSGDAVSLNDPSSGLYDNKNTGTGKTVTVTGVVPTGTAASNYRLASSSLSANVGVVDLAVLSITADNISAPTLALANPTASYSGFANGETRSLVTGLQYGLFPVTGTSLQYDVVPFGASAPNYAITYFPGLLTLNPPPPNDFTSPLIGNGGYGSLSTFVVTRSFGSVTYNNVATAAIGNRAGILLFNVGLPGTIYAFGAIMITDYSNATNDYDRLARAL